MKDADDLPEAAPKHFHVCIFGSARIGREHPTYTLVHDLAKEIAKAGLDVVTGGGPGLMEAANKGHHEGRKDNNSHSIGLNIRLPSEQKANAHLDIKKEFSQFSRRLDNFMLLSNVVVVAPGGVGTLLEFLYTWQLIQVKQMENIPIILLGDMWLDFIDWIRVWPLNSRLIGEDDLNPIFFAKTVSDALQVISKAHENFKAGGENFCLSYKGKGKE
ncbi:LOG family protein YgdH [archaeon BMS3Abin16]|nr:LOG family protein YgdH [archaeon BMS3Abin16]HDY74201.1 LOG family protein [Euryarchaeota archaeon]